MPKGISGGYVIHHIPLVRERSTGDHPEWGPAPRVSDTDLRALNAIQATPWRINRSVLEVASAAFDAGMTLAGLPEAQAPLTLPKFAEEVWEAMSAEERKAHVRSRRDAHESYASLTGRRQATLDHLTVATEMQDAKALWFPHSRDFRGRVYPVATTGPTPQSSDLGKALLEFERGLDLGETGLFWLMVRAANVAGHDKLGLAERAQWTGDHRTQIEESAQDPFGCTWWAEADEPWQFLATCFELADAWAMDDPRDFISHLPVQMDGTCNGLQHLSAMGLDPVGARATNLAAGDVREDIYERVAETVRAKVTKDAEGGRVEAIGLLGTITRATVKRAVMTTPLTY